MKRKLALPRSGTSKSNQKLSIPATNVKKPLLSSNRSYSSDVTSLWSTVKGEDFSCQICGVNLERLNFQQRTEHVNHCIDGITSLQLKRGAEREEGDRDDFMESPPSQKLHQNLNRKKPKSEEGATVAAGISSSATESLDSQISRCRSRLIEIEGQLAECHYQRLQVNKELKRLLKKQSLESKSLQSNLIELLPAIPVKEMLDATFGEIQPDGDRHSSGSRDTNIKQPIDSMEYPLWSLSHQSTLFDNVISQTEPASNGLISLSHYQREQPDHQTTSTHTNPSLFSQLEAAVHEVMEATIPPPVSSEDGSGQSLQDQLEGILTAVSQRVSRPDGSINQQWNKLKEQLQSTRQLLERVLKTTPELEHLEKEERIFSVPCSPAVLDTSLSDSFLLSQTQTVVVVSDSDDVPSQQKELRSPHRSSQENDSLHLLIDDSPIIWRNSAAIIHLSSPPHLPLLEDEVHSCSARSTAPLGHDTPAPPMTSGIFALEEMPSLADHSSEQLKQICRSYGLKQSDNPVQMRKALTSLWRRHHHSRSVGQASSQPLQSNTPHQLSSTDLNSSSIEAQIDVMAALEAKKKIRAFLKSDEELYSRILSYQSVDLESMKIRLKESGVEVLSHSLREFLDEEGVFVTSS
jgi:hypothetical protein